MTELPEKLRQLLQKTGTEETYCKGLVTTFVAAAMQSDIDEQAIIDACLDANFAGNSINQYVSAHGGEDFVLDEIERVANTIPASPRALITIKVQAGKEVEQQEQIEREIISRQLPAFWHARRLVYPCWRREKINKDPNDPNDRDRWS